MAKISLNMSRANTHSLFSPSDQLSVCLTGLSRPANRRHGQEWRFTGILLAQSLYHESQSRNAVCACLFSNHFKPAQSKRNRQQHAWSQLPRLLLKIVNDIIHNFSASIYFRDETHLPSRFFYSQHSTLQFWAPWPWMHSQDAKDWFSQFATVAGLVDSHGDSVAVCVCVFVCVCATECVTLCMHVVLVLLLRLCQFSSILDLRKTSEWNAIMR